MTSSIRYDLGADGIVLLTLDAPNDPVNTMNAAFQVDLAAVLERLNTEKDKVKGVIFTSAKSTFFAGGDLRWLITAKPADAPVFFESIQKLKALLRGLEKLGRPVVAAMNGSALGGGLELALSCHHRVCLDNPKIEIGFPEVTLGLLPGGGGVVKASRLMGLINAMPYLTEGQRVAPTEALEAGLIHAVVSTPEALMENARAFIAANPSPVQPWDNPEYKIPGDGVNGPGIYPMLPVAPALMTNKTRGNFPAPEAILSAAVEGLRVDFDTAMRIESRYFVKLATDQVSKNMIGTFFFQMNEVKAGKSRPVGPAKWKASKVGILGAGMMGAGIAWACANRGIACVLKDTDQEKADKGKAYTGKLLAKRVEKNRMSAADAEKVLELIRATSQVGDLRDCDLIVEAVFENQALKARVTKEVEAVIGSSTVFASNTSTLPISGLAKASARPENFVGLHFFSPVDKMPLVEIVKGAKTSPETLAKAYDFVLQIGKTPIVVNDARGFYTSRVFGTFVNEGLALVGEGVPASVVENYGIQTGMPVGPLAVLDEVSLKLADDVLHQELAELEKQAHAAEHGESDAHDHDHDHDHNHGHGHDHGHGHAHDKGQAHSHADDHSHSHEHSHDKLKTDDKEHDHHDEHDHDHHGEHQHAHSHDEPHDHAKHDEHAHAHEGHDHEHGHKPPLARAQIAAKTATKHSHRVKSKRMPEDAVYVLEKMSHGYKRMGRAYGGGFYEYPEGQEKHLWEGLKTFVRASKNVPHEDIRDRMLYIQALETLRCMQEGVVESTRDANIGSIFGWGFPPYTGGTAQFVNHIGVAKFVERSKQLAAKYGERFTPPAILLKHAQDGTSI